MCVALEIITRPYTTIAAADNSNGRSIRRNNRLLSAEKIAKSFPSKNFNTRGISSIVKFFLPTHEKTIRNAQCVMRNKIWNELVPTSLVPRPYRNA